jgi:tetratricopeptide (TPR) repeat protein
VRIRVRKLKTQPAPEATLGNACRVDAECGTLRCDKVRRQCICLSDMSCLTSDPFAPPQYCNNYTGLCVTEITGCKAEQSRYDIEEPYFGMYLSIHEYAAEKLAASGHEAKLTAEERHGRYFARFGTEAALEALSRQGGVKLRRVLALQLDNLVAACRRAVGRANGEYAVATYQAVWAVLELQGSGALGIDLGSQVLALDTLDASQRAAALHERAIGLRRAGRTEEAASGLEQALGLSRASGDRRREARVLGSLGNLRRDQGRMVDARAHLETSLAMAREIRSRRFEGNLIGHLGILHAVQGRLEEARAHFEQALVVHREVGNRRFEGIDLGNLGSACQQQGKLEQAKTHFEQALTIHREVGNRREEGIVVGNLGLLCSDLGLLDAARQLCEDALAIHREVGDRPFEGAMLGALASVLHGQGRTEEALVHYDQALAVHRAVGNRRAEGADLGGLGQLLTTQGRFSEAREALRTGEALLREVGDKLTLAILLCKSGHTELAGNDVDAARAALAAAEEAVEAMGAGPDSEAGRAVAKLRSVLA